MAEEQTAEVLETPQDGSNKEIEETTIAEPDGGEVEAKETDEETEEAGHKRLGGWQRKIKKQEQQIVTLIELLRKAAPQEKAQATADDKSPVKPTRPKQSEFAEWEKWEAALEKYEGDRDKYYEDKLEYELKQVEVTKQKKSEQEKVVSGWAAQVAEAKKQFEDFEEVAFSKDVPITNAMMDAIVTSDVGAKIAYELGQDVEEATRISKLPAVAAHREIGKIESRILGKKSVAGEEETAAPTRAPKPPVPVRKTTATDTGLRDDIPYKEWLRRREAQLGAK